MDGQLATAELAATMINVVQLGRVALQMAGAAAEVAPEGAKTVEGFLPESQRRLDATNAKQGYTLEEIRQIAKEIKELYPNK